MKHLDYNTPINLLALQPESGKWVAVSQQQGYATRPIKYKLIITVLAVIVIGYSFNLIKIIEFSQVKSEQSQTSTVEVNAKAVALKQRP